MDTGERLLDENLNGNTTKYFGSVGPGIAKPWKGGKVHYAQCTKDHDDDEECPICEYKEQEKLSPNENNNELFRDIRKNHMRNKPCPCGSGKKFKSCCWNKFSPKAVQARVKETVAKRNKLQADESLTD